MVAWFGIAYLILYLVFLGGGWAGIYSVHLRIASLVLIVAGLGGWALLALFRPLLRPRSAIWPAFAVALATLALATVFSRDPRISVEYVAWASLLAALYLLLQRLLSDPFFRPRLMGLAVLICAAVGILYVLVCVNAWVGWWGLVGHLAVPPLRPGFASFTWGNPSAVMTIAVLFLASSIGHLGLATRGRVAAVVFLTALTLLVTLLSGSRAGWLGLAIALVVTVVAWMLAGGGAGAVRRLARARSPRIAFAGLALGGITVVAIALTATLAPAVLSRAQSGGEALRASYYAAAWRMGLDSPLVGSGPGMWVSQRVAYTPAPETDYYIPHAHDVYLQTFAESGVLGLVAGVVAVSCLLWLIARAVRSGDPVRRRYGWCVLFASVYFGAHQLLDFYPNMPAALFAFALPIAWLDAASDRMLLPDRPSARLRRLGGAMFAGLVVASVAVLAWSEVSAVRLDEAVNRANRSDWAAARGPAEDAVRLDPSMPPNQLVLGLAAARAGDVDAAERAFAAAAAADDLPTAWLDLAAVQATRGSDGAARESLRRALRLGIQQPAVAFAAGDLYARLGDRASARDGFVAAIRGLPSLAGDPYWTATDDRSAAWPQTLDEALGGMPPETGFDAALSAGDADRARGIAATIADPGGRSRALTVIDGWTGSDPAWADLQTLASENPLDLTTLIWTARVAEHRGDHASAERYRAWIDVVLGGAGATGREVRVGPTTGDAEDVAGIASMYYGHYTYRRPTPWDQLVVGLPTLVYR